MHRSSKTAWAILATVLLLPLISMSLIPFYDTSEPRYAEIARIMAESGDWITPWFSPGVPFWGKPPLSFWAQALSMKAFGYTEFAGRFPSWICLLLTNAVLLSGIHVLRGPRIALWTAVIYSTCTLVYISSGAVLTDPFLALGTTLSLVSWAVSVHNKTQSKPGEKPRHDWWPYGFFIGLTIGLLAKGPLAVVLTAAPILTWYALNHKSVSLVASLPWLKGLLLTAALSLPWYILAEIKTPGFLDYFIVGEHFRRFLDPGWTGDLYGTAHKQAYGTIWYYWLQASFPWGVLTLIAALGALRSTRLRSALRSVRQDPWCSYWLASALFAPLFFTFSANILWTYLLPSLAGFSVLAAGFAQHLEERLSHPKVRVLSAAGIVPAVILALSAVAWIKPDLRNTERSLVRYAMQHNGSIPLLYLSTPPFSAQFYSGGRARAIQPNELAQALESKTPFYLAIPKEQKDFVAKILKKTPSVAFTNKRYALVEIRGATQALASAIAKDSP